MICVLYYIIKSFFATLKLLVLFFVFVFKIIAILYALILKRRKYYNFLSLIFGKGEFRILSIWYSKIALNFSFCYKQAKIKKEDVNAITFLFVAYTKREKHEHSSPRRRDSHVLPRQQLSIRKIALSPTESELIESTANYLH